ncbi:MAG: hypothetical protein ACREPI_13555 [Candidatus Dormibacterales bacterium]
MVTDGTLYLVTFRGLAGISEAAAIWGGVILVIVMIVLMGRRVRRR